MINRASIFFTFFAALELAFSSHSLQAQTIPDTSLAEQSSQIRPGSVEGNPVEIISGGARRNDSLFHSFGVLNVAPSRGLYFEDPGVRSIFARVTGSNPSNISGTLGVLGNANLFLLNPNGIIFSETARLDLRGSFLATTANSINFNEFQFTAENPQPVPLLTITTPVGLGFSQSPTGIRVQGSGHSLEFEDGRAFAPDNPFDRSSLGSSGLQVDPGQSLSLIGGQVNFNGGIVVAESGNIEVAAIDSGQVGLSDSSGSLEFNYSKASFQDIRLLRLSLLDASGTGGSAINLHGRNVDLRDGSYALIQNRGIQSDNEIRVVADNLTVQGNRLNSPIPLSARNPLINAGILSNTTQAAQGANINIEADRVNVDNAGSIRSASFGTGVAGDINVLARQVNVQGDPVSALNLNVSNIQSTNVGVGGNTGNVTIEAQQLLIERGGIISTNTDNPVASTIGGTLSIQSDSVTVTGQSQFFPFSSALATFSTNASQAGETIIRADSLVASNGALVGSIAFSAGRSGNVLVDADTVTVEGSFKPNSLRPASLSLSLIEDPSFTIGITSSVIQSSYNPPLSSSPFGNLTGVGEQGGSLTINAQQLNVRDAGFVVLLDKGSGQIGNLSINADQINLDRGGITAVTLNSEAGNIRISSQSLNLNSGSLISTSARGVSNGGSIDIQSDFVRLGDGSIISANNEQASVGDRFSGNGGNIDIRSQLLVGQNQSEISANAQLGTGGRVRVVADGFFFDSTSPITATSGLGPEFDGVVEIQIPDIDTAQTLPLQNAPESPPQLVSACQSERVAGQSQFVISGASGNAISPETLSSSLSGWSESAVPQFTPSNDSTQEQPTGLEAQGWVSNKDGTISFSTTASNGTLNSDQAKSPCQSTAS